MEGGGKAEGHAGKCLRQLVRTTLANWETRMMPMPRPRTNERRALQADVDAGPPRSAGRRPTARRPSRAWSGKIFDITDRMTNSPARVPRRQGRAGHALHVGVSIDPLTEPAFLCSPPLASGMTSRCPAG